MLTDSEQEEILFRLLEHHGINRLDWATTQEVEIEEELWNNYVADLNLQKPVQYILGYEYFAGEKFTVNKNVLIPRPETEELVNWIAEDYSNEENLNVLEIGTGSGCISISLSKKLSDAKIVATDISVGALAIAKKNSTDLGSEIYFLKDDILNTELSKHSWDIIVSNPPYIPVEESNLIDVRVKNHEPNIALFTEEKKPLQFYEAIINFAIKSLKPSGSLYFEMHEDYAQSVAQLPIDNGLLWEIKNDIYGKQRMIRIKKGAQ